MVSEGVIPRCAQYLSTASALEIPFAMISNRISLDFTTATSGNAAFISFSTWRIVPGAQMHKNLLTPSPGARSFTVPCLDSASTILSSFITLGSDLSGASQSSPLYMHMLRSYPCSRIKASIRSAVCLSICLLYRTFLSSSMIKAPL